MKSMETQKQSDPRKRILEVADRLFYAEGVRATGTEKIMAIAEVAKAFIAVPGSSYVPVRIPEILSAHPWMV